MTKIAMRALLGLTAAIWMSTGMSAKAADVAGSKDSPRLERLAGSEIAFYKLFTLDEAFLLRAPMELRGPANFSGSEWLRLEGRVTQIRYAMAGQRSSLQVLRDFEAKLTRDDFQIVFTCRDMECLANGRDQTDVRFLGERIDPHISNPLMYFDHDRYLLAKRNLPDGPVYVSILVGERLEQSVAFVQVVEPQQPDVVEKTPSCPQLFGKWRNVDRYTRSISRAEVSGSCDAGARIVIHAWGACTPKECDWGNIPAQYNANRREITATTQVSFEVTQLAVTLNDAGNLVVKSSTHFTDKSGRPDMDETDIFERY